MNDQEYLNIMAELKFIGSIHDNQFINLTSKSIENKNLLTSALRELRKYWYNTESGQASAQYCRDVIVRALKLYDKYTKEPGLTEFAKTIRKYIISAKIGMEHLKQTHFHNNMAYALFDTIIVTIEQRLNIVNDQAERLVSFSS